MYFTHVVHDTEEKWLLSEALFDSIMKFYVLKKNQDHQINFYGVSMTSMATFQLLPIQKSKFLHK